MLLSSWCFNRTLTEKGPTASPQFVFGRYSCPPVDAVLCPVARDTARDAPVCVLGIPNIPDPNLSPSRAVSRATGPPYHPTIAMQGQLFGINFGDIHAKY
jgi:hypothetical protein